MEFVLGTGVKAAGLTFALVAAYKFFAPSAPAWSVLVVAFVAGQVVSLAVPLSEGAALSVQTAATAFLGGLGATLMAVGARGLDHKADEKRGPETVTVDALREAFPSLDVGAVVSAARRAVK